MKSLKKLIIPYVVLIILIVITVICIWVKISTKGQFFRYDYREISLVCFSRKSDSLNIEATPVVSDDSVDFDITSPVRCKSGSNFNSMIDSLKNLSAESFFDIDESELSLYKLDEPELVFDTTKNDGNTIHYGFSSSENGYYYGYCSLIEGYFIVEHQQLMFIEAPAVTYIFPYINYCEATDISSITCTYGENKFILDIVTDYPLDDTRAIEIGGIEFNSDITYSKTDFSLRFFYKDYSLVDILFIQRDNYSYYVFIHDVVSDHEYTGFFVFADELFKNSGTNLDSYGVWATYELFNTAVSESINGVYDIPT